MNLIQLSETFKAARLLRRLTQDEVAAATDIGRVTISKFERGALTEIGVVKLLALFRAVGLELEARPAGHRRTLDDLKSAAYPTSSESPGVATVVAEPAADLRNRRVRHSKRAPRP